MPSGRLAAEIKWLGGGGDNSWTNAAKWAGGVVPGATDDVVFDLASGGTVIVSESVDVKSLHVFNNGNWTFQGSGVLNFDESFWLEGGGNKTIRLQLSGAGKLILDHTYTGLTDCDNNLNDFSGGVEVRKGQLRIAYIGNGPIWLYGGRYALKDGWSANVTNALYLSGDVTLGWMAIPKFTGPVTLLDDCTLTFGPPTYFYGPGELSGDHTLTLKGNAVEIYQTNALWGGTLVMENSRLRVGSSSACGTDRLVLRAGNFAACDGYDVTLNDIRVVIDGNVQLGWIKEQHFQGVIELTGNHTVQINSTTSFLGKLDGGEGDYTFTKSGNGTLNVAGDNSDFAGGWRITQGKLYFNATTAVGTGGIVVGSGASAYYNLDSSWVMAGDIGGSGALFVGTYNGNANRTLTLSGSAINPGTNSTVSGIFSIDNGRSGKYAHVVLAEDDGKRASLIIDVTGAGVVAGTDHDQLKLVRGDLSGLSDADLVVRVNEGLTPEALENNELVIVTTDNSSTISGQFAAVMFEPDEWRADVVYGTSTITLKSFRQVIGGTIILIK